MVKHQLKKSAITTDVIIIGGGAAGLWCAARAAERGRRVVVLDHAPRLGEKIRISGGGRCNFTNLNLTHQQYVSQNANFCRSALARFTPTDFLKKLAQYKITWHEKHLGQLFCDTSAQAIVEMLLTDCQVAGVQLHHPVHVQQVTRADEQFTVTSLAGDVWSAAQLVVASGGLAVPQIGASQWGLQLAAQFGLPVVAPRAGLVPLVADPQTWQTYAALAGVALPARVCCGKICFEDDVLFTHRGLSGPAILQISSYWNAGERVRINWLPHVDTETLWAQKQQLRQQVISFWSQYLPRRFLEVLLAAHHSALHQPVATCTDKVLRQMVQTLQEWSFLPAGTAGYKKAEVMRGGVDTRALSSQTMMAKQVPGLFFIGEVIDVTGWLGGYNFHWAWASADAAAHALAA